MPLEEQTAKQLIEGIVLDATAPNLYVVRHWLSAGPKSLYSLMLRLWLLSTILIAGSCGDFAQPDNADSPFGLTAEKPRGRHFELRLGDFVYVGAFRVPAGQAGISSFSYGGTALAFNPQRNSLFIVGHDHQQAVAELDIPAVINSYHIEDLETATVLQPFTDIKSRIPDWSLEGNTKIGGLLVAGHELIGSIYEYYDADANAVQSHFKLSSLNLTKAAVTGLFRMGNLGGGFVGGYMAAVPCDWQERLGASHVTGQAGLSIISRTSSGPASFGFDPAQLGSTAAPFTPLVYYPLAHPLAKEDTQNPYFNTTTQITGMVFPAGTDTVLFFGSHGVGPWWYGSNGEVPGMNDSQRSSKGPHAAPYVYQAWAYDAFDLLAVKNRSKEPWQIKPQDVWTFDLPFEEGSKKIGGVAFDSRTGRLYLSQLLADRIGYDMNPVIHVFQQAMVRR